MATDAGSPSAGLFDEAHDMATPTHADFIQPSDSMQDREEADSCRICRGEGTPEEPLFFPCKCSGSIKYVHQECLMEWLSHTQKKHCELCKTSFRFTKLYHPGMPNRIPTSVFIRRAALHVLNMFVTWCRGVLVGAVWLVFLPWCMRVVWRSLFWVGDGAWSQDMIVDMADATETSRRPTIDTERLHSMTEATNSHRAAGDWPLSGFLGSLLYSSKNSTGGSSLWRFAKQFLTSVPYPFAQLTQIAQLGQLSGTERNSTATNSTSNSIGSIHSHSLLSDVPFFYKFPSQAANRFIIDVLEGQIITLFVVVAFILIFLIREWVVQQQPVINMVALGDEAAAQRAADHAHEPEHEHLHDESDEEEDDSDADEVQQNDVDVPVEVGTAIDNLPAPEPTIRRVRRSSSLRRRGEEVAPELDRDDVGEDIKRTLRSGSPEEVKRTLSKMGFANTDSLQESLQRAYDIESRERATQSSSESHASNGDFQEEAGPSNPRGVAHPMRTSSLRRQSDSTIATTSAERIPVSQRPHMPTRDQSFNATEIRRQLEEENSWSFSSVPQASSDALQATKVPDSWEDEDDTDHRHLGQGPDTLSDQAPDSEHSSGSWQQVPDVVVDDDSNQALERDDPRNKGKAKAVDDGINTVPIESAHLALDSFSASEDESPVEAGPEEETSLNRSEHDPEVNHENLEVAADQQLVNVDAAIVPPVAPADLIQPPANPLDRALDWMFGDVAPTTPAENVGDNEHVVRNIADEAPFVPFIGNDPQQHGVHAMQDPEVAAAAAQAGIDVNDDQEAIEDAEDLEGILELIGMQGPIVGLFQNALFSAVLISATLACALWLPYLWGKVVILFMGSPISLFIKLPLQLVATATDLIVDVTLFLVAGLTYCSSHVIAMFVKLCSWGKLSQAVDGPLRSVSGPAHALAQSAIDRLAKSIVDSPLSPSPDYFRLSVNSHAALRGLQNSTSFALNETSNFANAIIEEISADSPFRLVLRILGVLPSVVQTSLTTLYAQGSALVSWVWASKSYKITLNLDLGHNTTAAYTTMERWTGSDRMIAIFAGYGFFAMAGAVYLKRGTPFSTSPQGQKIERIISDILQQAGGVLKVILIISIEMLAFPLYCGLLLDLAMLPLFKNATLLTRWQFTRESPWTSGFVHWFIGTCYMFHFALFVSMCRKIMRKGVLYFIRDPDDPTFHPVRDVLERSVTTQLRKIAFSALVYGALVIVCLGGVVWTLSRMTSEVLPIHWTTEAPSLEFPLDLLFYNFLTPVIIKFYKPSESLHTIYKWWFKTCAGFLRLSNFLFGDKVKEQEGDDGKYVLAPASDQARIPKGHVVFVEVDENNVRKDGKTEGGVHNTDLVSVVFIPPWFRLRIFCFVVTIWIFMGLSGVSVTILPLLFGRFLFSLFLPKTVEMNDIHAFSLGVYTLGSIFYSAYHAYTLLASLNRPVPDPMSTFHTVTSTTRRIGLRVLRFSYVWASLIFAIPFLCAVLIELYFLMPLHAYLGPKEPHVVHLIQDWTLGFLYARLAARLVFANRNSRPARAFTAVVRDGYLYPDARVATRCFVLPVVAMFLIAIAIPSSLSFVTNRTLYYGATAATKNQVWRFSFPAVGLSLAAMWVSNAVIRLLVRWRLIVRDEVYLIGERLHNFGEKKAVVLEHEDVALVGAPVAEGAEGQVA